MRLAITATVFLVVWGLTTHGKHSVSGDEPHYLIVAHSLLTDGDLDLRNNYRDDDGRFFGAAGLQPEQHARVARDGRLLPAHDIGLPLLVLPVYGVALRVAANVPPAVLARFRMTPGLFAYSIVSLAIALLFAMSAATTWSAVCRSGVSPRASAFVVLPVWLTAPVLSNSFLVFPEAIALAVTAWTVCACARGKMRWTASDLLLVLALGALPWVHRKYAVYAFALLAVVAWIRRGQLRKPATVAAAAAAYVIPQLALALWTYHHWGNLAGPIALDRMPFSRAALGHGVFGTFFDRENGLLWWAPAYALLPAAWALSGKPNAVWLTAVVALVMPGAAHDQWWGGFSPAARFLVPLAPIVCAVCTPALVQSVRLRAVAIALLIPQLVVAGYGWQRPRLLWPEGNGVNRVLAVLAPWINAWAPSYRLMIGNVWLRTVELLAVVVMVNAVAIALAQREIATPVEGPVSPASRR